MNKYICPFCKLEMDDNVAALVAHRAVGGVCDVRMSKFLNAAERDLRWARMAASVAPVKITELDRETGYDKQLERVTEFRIEIRVYGTLFTSIQRVLNDDLEQFPKLYNLTLDKMVQILDELLHKNEYERRMMAK